MSFKIVSVNPDKAIDDTLITYDNSSCNIVIRIVMIIVGVIVGAGFIIYSLFKRGII